MQLNAAQAANARAIVAVGRSQGMSDRDIETALMVAITESSLLMYANSSVPSSLSYSHDAVGHDTDSLGLFQQRPSAGWGSVAQLMNASYDAGKFYSVLRSKGQRIVQTPWAVAQSVQVSAYADGSNYQANWANAQEVFKAVTGKAAGGGAGPVSGSSSSGGNTSAGNATSSAGSTPAGGNPSLFGSLATITQDLTSSEWWRRVGMFIAGGVLLLIGILVIVHQSGVVSKGAKAVAHVGELAALA